MSRFINTFINVPNGEGTPSIKMASRMWRMYGQSHTGIVLHATVCRICIHRDSRVKILTYIVPSSKRVSSNVTSDWPIRASDRAAAAPVYRPVLFRFPFLVRLERVSATRNNTEPARKSLDNHEKCLRSDVIFYLTLSRATMTHRAVFVYLPWSNRYGTHSRSNVCVRFRS